MTVLKTMKLKRFLPLILLLAGGMLFADDAPAKTAGEDDTAGTAVAQAAPGTPTAPAADEPEKGAAHELALMSALLGASLKEILDTQGLPDSMFTQRGPHPGQDSVVFYYSGQFYLYWAESHVWQVRKDWGPGDGALNLHKGVGRDEAESLLGKPGRAGWDYDIFTLPQ